MQGRLGELRARGLGVAAISYDPGNVLAAFARRHGIEYPLLSDPDSETIRRYNLYNTLVDEALGPNGSDPELQKAIRRHVAGGGARPFMKGIAIPCTLVLDREGRVKARYLEDSYVERPTVSRLLLDPGGGAGAVDSIKIETSYLTGAVYPSDLAVTAGNHFAIVARLAPKPGIHVYAPGNTGYKAVALRIAPMPGVSLPPMQFPQAETWFFAPLKETVKVFQQPFTLVQEVIVGNTKEIQAAMRSGEGLTLTGELEFQACDDKECFRPVSIPLSWKIGLRPLVTERPVQKGERSKD